MRDVEGDGNCLYRVIADQLEGSEADYKKFREMAVKYLTEHKDYFSMFLMDHEDMDTYIKHAGEDGSWGGTF